MEIQELHRGRLIDHIQLVVADIEASRRFYRALFEALAVPMGGEADDYFWADELFVSTASSAAAQGRLTGPTHLAFQGLGPRRRRPLPFSGPRGGRNRQRRARRAPLPPRLLRRLPARSRRQQYRSRLPRRGTAERAIGQDHLLRRSAARRSS